MDIIFEEQPNTLLIRLLGELDHHNSITAKERIDLKLSCGFYKQIVYSLEELSFMDSSGIGLLANGYKTAQTLGAKVSVYTQNPKYQKIFTMAKLEDLVQIITNRKDLTKVWKS